MVRNSRINLVIGIIIGIAISTSYFSFFASRYEIRNEGLSTIKVDKWTGLSWRMVDNDWKSMGYLDANLEDIDQTLREALNIPTAGVDRENAVVLLKDKYPILKGLTDQELNERIKLVYSREILVDLYLNDFVNIEQNTHESTDG